ncbi:hypothetical protein R9C00_20550 [Flammeovirgaceae bacterium SG7u.111]|nr:hypothetical protein [Flammeovirgaceae bacterium SG7u.132]WPO34093.1 hypothetical protein R9C00_20550 [Flammeovirgaceae bacterium SG7u.111]
MANVMEAIPEEAKTKPYTQHNLDKTAWKPIPRSEPATLIYFMADYVGHLQHHLGQVFEMQDK